MLTQQRLRELFNYDPETGVFTRRFQGQGMHGVQSSLYGKPAGSLQRHGYKYISIEGEKFRTCRLAWLYMTGEWPQHEVDHTNNVRSDDSWDNLRQATSSENKWNSSIRSDNKSGVKGVIWNKKQGMWQAYVRCYGKQYHCGYFASLEEAAEARRVKADELHGVFAKFDTLPTMNPN